MKKYEQIIDDIHHQILNGELKANDRLPTEYELSEQYGVSRITSKRALTELEQMGLVYRHRGRGTFIRSNVLIKDKVGKILFVSPFGVEQNSNSYFDGIAKKAQTNATQILRISNADFQELNIDEILHSYDGLIFYPTNLSLELDRLTNLFLLNFPIVLIDQPTNGTPFPTISSDNIAAGHLAAKSLIALGHQKIAFIGNYYTEGYYPSSVRQRYIGYLEELKANNLQYFSTWSEVQNLTKNGLAAILSKIKFDKVTAIIFENDLTAIKWMNDLQKNGISVPKDLSIIGFDNLNVAELSYPSLTSVAQNFTEIGEQAASVLFNLINNPFGQKHINISVPVTLKKRNSISKRK